MKTFTNQVAQGDMLLRRIEQLPDGAEPVAAEKGAYVLAHSETGHNHVVMERPDVRFYQDRQNLFLSWLVVEGEPVELEHQRDFHTHESIQIEPGVYEVRRQREYTPEGYRRAQD
ncbi:MAG: hypothetical protein ACOY4K_00735 [Pseudomonadota bacterium]